MGVIPALAVVTVLAVTNAVAENFMKVRLSKLAIGPVPSVIVLNYMTRARRSRKMLT
ncbi:hypothetical protein [Rhizobium sp. PL01]|uniref:hypothetical protein n=1 Tax=Rhizobium sp. PL01 TaxID=3085631 RepID=UPI002981EF38|nr:hypothetical protein [Rhizobium sp. PL01]MDW5314439.1 hypothetical protein [Rhizobium sp. PL01]